MEEQKILFADLYRLTEGIKEELKVLNKELPNLLKNEDWPALTAMLNIIHSEAAIIYKMSECIAINVNEFLDKGPYEGQRGGRMPLESLAEEDDGK